MRVVIAHEEARTRDYLRQVALSLGLGCEANDAVSFADLRLRLAQGPSDLVVVAIGSHTVAALPVIQLAATHTRAPVLAVGPSTDPHLILQAIRSGAREYLDESNLRDELGAALAKLSQAGVVNYRRGRMAAVCAALPGSGVTTVATNLAFALGAKYPRRVALAEIGASVPEMALALDLEPRHCVLDLAQNWDRLDTTMLQQTLVEHPAGVHVLAYKPETLAALPLELEPMQHTALLLKAMFEFTVLDLGHQVDAAVLRAMNLSDVIVLVVRLDVPSLRLTRRLLNQLQQQHGIPTAKLQVVANRYGQRKQIPWKQAEETLGLPLLEGIPDDPSTLNDAVNHGMPLIRTARRASITRCFDKLATRLNGTA